jgi:hypothetical protein
MEQGIVLVINTLQRKTYNYCEDNFHLPLELKFPSPASWAVAPVQRGADGGADQTRS